MKPVLRSSTDIEEADRFSGAIGMDSSFRLLKVMSSLVIFVAGVVLGLAASSHITTYFQSHTEMFFTQNRNLPRGSPPTVCENPPVIHGSPPPIPESPPFSEKESCVLVNKCEKVDCFKFRSFVNPGNATHIMTDGELFWRASLVPMIQEYPYRRVRKVAFMFLTRGPLPFSPLWDKFFRGHEKLFSVYVHALPGYKLNVPNTSAFYGRQIKSQVVKWGSPTLTDAERRLLANALLDYSNERFVLLSESCIPIYDFNTVYKYLINSAHSFVESYDDPSRYGRGRYHRNMYPEIKLHQWRKGSQWFEMNRSLAVNIISDTKYYSIFRKYCLPSCYPDEHYIPTYLNMFFQSLNSNRTVTWVDWSLGGPHPAKYGAENITEDFIRSIRNNGTYCSYNSERTSLCYLFARKFAPSALEPLLNLTTTVMNF